MLRSPLTNPITTPMINPIRTGISEITRAILNFNGTQYGQLSDVIDLSGYARWELIFVCVPAVPTGSEEILLGNSVDARGFIRIKQRKVELNFSATGGELVFSSMPYIEPGRTYSISVKRDADSYTVSYAGQSQTITETGLTNMDFDWLGAKNGDGKIFHGYILSVEGYRDGFSDSGERIPGLGNVALSDRDTIYQRDLSVTPLEAEFSPVVGGSWVDNGGGSYTYEGEYNQQIADSQWIDGVWYEVKFRLSNVTQGAIEVRPVDVWFDSDGLYSVMVQASDIGIAFGSILKDGLRFHGTVSDITVARFYGVILKNIVEPGDWQSFSYYDGDQYMLGDINLAEIQSPTPIPSVYEDGVLKLARTAEGVGATSVSISLMQGYLHRTSFSYRDYTGVEEIDALRFGSYGAFYIDSVFQPIGSVPDFVDYSGVYLSTNATSLRVLSGGSGGGVDIRDFDIRMAVEVQTL